MSTESVAITSSSDGCLQSSISHAGRVPPEKEGDFRAALWILNAKLLKKSRYAKLGLGNDEANSIAAQAVAESLPLDVKGRTLELEKRLRTALDDRAAALAIAQRPTRVIGPVPIQKLAPRRDRKALGYGYKPPQPGKPIPFSDLRFDTEKFSNAEDYLGNELYKLERKQGSESERSRLAREEREVAIERAAGTVRLAPVLEGVRKICDGCGEPIPGEAKRFVILQAELPCVGLEVIAIEALAVVCEKCRGKQPKSDPLRDAEGESWMETLSANEREALRLRKTGLNQTEIGRKMGKSQETISRLLKSADGKRREALAKKLRSTGGA